MREIIKGIAAIVSLLAITFGLVCIAVLLFSICFGFEWSFLLCVCVWMALIAARWVMQGAKND